ncbi:MAG: competence/damage-inducible protein A [Burkholderiaceae bacterium]|nr:competence/damage-inducible protein A [Burkholderiaceae bacterium]
MSFGLIVVGDEILSGKRQDKHFAKVIELLAARGLQLAWARYLGDDRARLVQALRESFAGPDTVFCCGGIGATPDDHTRQAAALALGVELELHPLARERIAARCAAMEREGRGTADMTTAENRQRLKMGEFPSGAQVIENPSNGIPGFSIREHFFLPGFPSMAWPMIATLLDTRLAHLHNRTPVSERALLLYEVAESAAVPLMETIESAHPQVRVFSLPTAGDDGRRRHIELGVRGPVSFLDTAFEQLLLGARMLGEVELTGTGVRE